MQRTVVLVLIAPAKEEAEPFRVSIENSPALRERVELRFATREEAPEAIRDAEVVLASKVTPELLASARDLRWISFWSAGLENKVTPEIIERGLLITNASGVHGPNIAEHVLAFMLMFTRGMPGYVRAQLDHRWLHNTDPRNLSVRELGGVTLGIVGLGRIGEALGIRARAFGMRVVAVKRDPAKRYNSAFQPDALYPAQELPRMLEESDHVCISVPYTRETDHLFDAGMLGYMKPSAYLYNISRGKIVEEAALVAALRGGRLAGAGLDVFETEPLPAESPLWDMKNVIITPHVAGTTPFYFQRVAELFADNLARYLDGRPLDNLYDPERGY